MIVNGHRDSDAIDSVVHEIESEGGRAIGVRADVADANAVGRMVATAVEAYGTVDIAVSNVGRRANWRSRRSR